RIMKAYGGLEKIAAAEPQDMAGQCGITEEAARAVRAAAKLALEDRDSKKKQFAAKAAAPQKGAAPGRRRSKLRNASSTAALADEAFAAEDTPEYK
ncbi:MAG: excinuclease ABC subunit C, partial [Treponema sp.]|nr:excinuclease ABC subunit C [Treponema sp.]